MVLYFSVHSESHFWTTFPAWLQLSKFISICTDNPQHLIHPAMPSHIAIIPDNRIQPSRRLNRSNIYTVLIVRLTPSGEVLGWLCFVSVYQDTQDRKEHSQRTFWSDEGQGSGRSLTRKQMIDWLIDSICILLSFCLDTRSPRGRAVKR